jgi:integrase
MTATWTIERPLHFQRAGHGRGQQPKEARAPADKPLLAGRVPRVAKLMALALHFEHLLRTGEIASYAELGRLGQVTRARICQIMNLTCLAPDLQEALLLLPRTERGRDRIILADLQPIAALLDWRQQRRRWAEWTKVGQGS